MSKAFRILASALGYDVVKHRRSESLARQLERYFANLQTDYVLDVGANVGQFGSLARAVGYAGPIVSCEPSDAVYKTLQHSAKGDSKWRTVCCAIGETDGDVSLNHFGGDTFSSTLQLNELGSTMFPGLRSTGSIVVKQLRLETLMQNEDVPRSARVFLKTDTQGTDMQVLRGLGDRFQQVQAVLIEMSVQGLYTDQPPHWEVLTVMRKNAFELYGFAPVARDKQGALIEYDALFYRR